MSTALPFLNKLRKPELVELAQRTDLKSYRDLTKPDLVLALDKHLLDNQSAFENDKTFAEYYKRLPSSSPVKNESSVEVASTARTPGRKPKQPKETRHPAAPPPRTASRSSRVQAVVDAVHLPPSPAVVTDAIDRQTRRVRRGLDQAWIASGVQEHTDSVRANLSSLKAVFTVIILLEAAFLLRDIIPLAYVTTTPAVPAVHLPSLPIKLPDLFVLLTASFWAPFSLWTLTNLALPLVAAYFFNLSWHAATGGQVRRTRSTTSQASFDPLAFSIAKAVLVYKVYVDHFRFFDVFSYEAIAVVNEAVPGGYSGVLAGTAIGVIGTLYEAILRR
ncbi:hypothetical protein N7468_003368 [Penicillium chermesinum]|uniref:Rho termination factor N-terminal domain-containing protein n=1 Tax=Penicillium chermesinum TaxID=63820 RepID=A0A9W9TTB0_9EURO|nr:uncharacterized protein N7468_003368 [Penicillium chermesinum]KAJ5238749.1 hypothetical protein N7468_003368 [Penicillium chermesinum]